MASFLGMRRITPSLQACGTDPVFQHELYRSRRAGSSEGQCFRMLYEMWSRGLGAEDDLDLKMISSTSLCEMGSLLNGMVASGGCGSQVGLVYDLGLLSYTCTSEKYDSTDCWSKQGMVEESFSLKSSVANLQKDVGTLFWL